MTNKAISTILADNKEPTRSEIRRILKIMPDILLLGETRSGKDLIRLAFEFRPALLLMDIDLLEMDGIEATRQIKESLPCKVMIITNRDSEDDIIASLSAGADGYALRNISAIRLMKAIDSVMEGGIWFDPGVARTLLLPKRQQNSTGQKMLMSANPFKLSEREAEILSLIVDGMSNHEIANKLCLSTETVKSHVGHLLDKLKVSGRTQAAVKAVREGLVPPEKDF